MKRKLLSILLSLAMVFSLLPVSAVAAEAQETTVYVSAAKGGEFLTGIDDTAIAYVPVQVSGDAPTIHDAFLALHQQYYDGDAADAYTGSGYTVSEFWGVSSTSVGYYLDDTYAMSLSDEVSDGSHIYFWFYQDAYWSDAYTYFDKTELEVSGGETFALTLTSADYMNPGPLSGAAITVDGRDSGEVTDADGCVSLQLTDDGTYLISAEVSDGSYIVPPVCIVTVSGSVSEDAQQQAVEADAAALTLTYDGGDQLALPTQGESGLTSIAWSSGDPDIISNRGAVVKQLTEQTVTMTAAISCGSFSDTREFTITVPALSEAELLERLQAAASALTADALAPVEYTGNSGYGYSYDSVVCDTNLLTKAQSIADEAAPGVQAAFDETFSAGTLISEDGDITYPAESASADVVFTLTLGGSEQTHAVTGIQIPAHTKTKAEAVQALMDSVTLESVLNGQTADAVSGELFLPAGSSYGLQVTWESDNEAVVIERATISSGGVTRQDHEVTPPQYGEEDAVVTLTATFDYSDSAQSYSMCDAGPMPADNTKTFSFTVPALSQEAYEALLAHMENALNTVAITLFADKTTAADLTAVTEDLMLPAPEGYATATVWTSDNDAIAAPAYSTGRAAVSRPAVGQADVTGDLTITITKNGYTRQRSIPATVRAWTQEDLDQKAADLQSVADALTFEAIKGKNTAAGHVTAKLALAKSAAWNNGAVKFYTYTSTTNPYTISWSITPAGIVDNYGNISRPDVDTEVQLTATVALKTPIDGIDPVTKVITLTVPTERTANTTADLTGLLENIAASYAQDDDTGEWVIMDMGAYATAFPEAVSATTDAALQSYLNTSIEALGGSTVGESTYSKTILALAAQGIDPKQLYAAGSTTPIDAVAALAALNHSSSAWSAVYTMAALQLSEDDIAAAEQALLSAVLAAQGEDGSWNEWGTIDTTANMLAGLSFYAGDADVDAAIDRGVAYLASQMGEDGTYDDGYGNNANSTAMVVIGLAAVGVNPDTDPRFIRNGSSVLDGLLSFAVGEDGFGYQDNTAISDYSTEQGFRALIAAWQMLSGKDSYNVYDFTANQLTPGYAVESDPDDDSGKDEGGSSGGSGSADEDTISITFTLKTHKETWIKAHSVELEEDATVADAFHEVLDGREGFSYVEENNYIRSITKNGKTWGEFDAGKNSGWKFQINGAAPGVGMEARVLEDGDDLVWYYVTDYTTDSTPDEDDDDKPAAEKLPTLEETAALALPFTDISEDYWAREAIGYVYGAGLMNGTAADTFSPLRSVTRGMIVTILYRLEGSPAVRGEMPFSDVAETAYCADAVKWAEEQNIAGGYADGTFRPNVPVSRQQLAAFLYRYADRSGADMTGSADLSGYDDADQVGEFARDAMAWANGAGLINGTADNRLNPAGTATRAQAAAILTRYLTK